jgi:DNA polymerase-3 subunit epsilon
MRNVLILDVETTGLDPEQHKVIELGYVLWSVEHRTILECYSCLFASESNEAQVFNSIPVDALRWGNNEEIAWTLALTAAENADCVVAHSAPFDYSFVSRVGPDVTTLLKLPWVCTLEDMIWPVQSAYQNLVSIALAHGVAVTSAHRAINDCLLLARLFERIDDINDRLHLAMQRAARPKAEFIARTSYQDKDKAKAAGFHWNGMVWKRYMAVEDALQLPFEVIDARELSP